MLLVRVKIVVGGFGEVGGRALATDEGALSLPDAACFILLRGEVCAGHVEGQLCGEGFSAVRACRTAFLIHGIGNRYFGFSLETLHI